VAKRWAVWALGSLVLTALSAQPIPPVPTVSVQFEGEFASRTNLRDRDGTYRLTRGGASVRYAGPLGNGPDGFGLALGYSGFDFDFSATPHSIGDARAIELGGLYRHVLSPAWAWFATGELQFGAEQGAALEDGMTAQVRTGAEWRAGPTLAVGFWVIAATRLENSTRVMPAIGLQWQATPRLSILTFNGVRAVYALDPHRRASLDFAITYESDQFRLRDRPSAADRALAFKQVPLTFGYTRRFADAGLVLRLYAQGAVWTEFDWRRDGRRDDRFRADPAWGGGISAGWSF
jgi:hypothetical protein